MKGRFVYNYYIYRRISRPKCFSAATLNNRIHPSLQLDECFLDSILKTEIVFDLSDVFYANELVSKIVPYSKQIPPVIRTCASSLMTQTSWPLSSNLSMLSGLTRTQKEKKELIPTDFLTQVVKIR